MAGLSWQTIITDILWVLVIGGWITLIITGLEADKPLSGGLPGHVDLAESHATHHLKFWDYVGEYGAWALFIVAVAALPVILWWIFSTHSG